MTIQQLQAQIVNLQHAVQASHKQADGDVCSGGDQTRIQEQDLTIQQLQKQMTSLQQSLQVAPSGDDSMRIHQLQTQLEESQSALEAERRMNRELRDQIAELQRQRDEQSGHAAIYRGDTALKEKVGVIECRGNIQVDGSTGHVNLLKPLLFVKQHERRTHRRV